ncbi:MAG: EAL domain-containing protein [Burkholderiales bacterium]|nr:EAL domain-containing protein [Burkholderiales bacterium]
MQREVGLKFDSAVTDARAAIESRVLAHSDVLLGVRGLFIASDFVSRRDFRDYIDSLGLQRHYPGIEAVNYAHRVLAAEKSAFEAAVRNDTSIDPRGYPDFAVKPAGDRPEYVAVQYVEPFAGRESALGFDLGGDAARLATLDRARDSGRITATGRIALVLDPSRPAGFAMRLPVYRKGMPLDTVAQRRAAFIGVVSTVFVVIDLMRGALGEPFLQTVNVRIHDAGFLDDAQGMQPAAAENLLFDSDRLLPASSVQQAADAGLSRMSSLDVGGRRWNLNFSARQEFASFFDRWLPSAVMLGGAIISLLLFGVIRSLASVGVRAVALAANITEDLRRSEANLSEAQRTTQELIEALPIPIFFKRVDGRYLGVNKAWERYFGVPREEFVGKTVHDLYPNDPEVARRLHAQDLVLWEHPGTQVYETSIATPDGRRHDTIYYKATLTNADGSVAGLIGTIIDITDRKLAEKALQESEARYRSVVGAMAEGVLVRDKDEGIVACNASAERILGRTLEEMRGSNYFDPSWAWFREDGTPLAHEARPVNMALRTGQPQFNEVVCLRKGDGSVIWLSMNAQPLFAESGSAPTGVVATLTDITQRKQAELRQNMEHSVTRLLSEAEAADEVMPKIIRTICEALGFACGARMLLDEEGEEMTCAESWSAPSAEGMEFVATGRQPMQAEPAARILTRRVWNSCEPVWITDALEEAGDEGAPLPSGAEPLGAFGFPIMFGNNILGVMEFFSRARRPPDEVSLQSMRSIGTQIGQFMARRQAEERVHHLAHYDELTGLPNRSMFNQRLNHALVHARRSDKSLAILFIDLDRFKNINDTLGHEAGDRVLEEVAQRLQDCLREGDTIGRLGGDEFVVLIDELPEPMHVAAVAQKILAAVVKPFIVGAQEFNITASIGISTYPEDSEDMQGLLKNADISMYRAKEQGKNNYQFYSALMNIHTVERLALESGLRRALERDEFRLHYQPKVDIASGRITGMEALLRWQQQPEVLLEPAQFIGLAEETGLIVPIGAWVLKTACARSRSWREQGLPPLRMAVNLSARQFAHQDLLQDVARTLKETGLDPAGLEFEITESMVMHDPERAVKLLGGLKDMGVHLSIDDFGMGYSSLSYLKRFPLDSLKIDSSFIRDIPGDADDAAITRAIIAMARSLRLKVIAEGVETEAQLAFLREHGCDEMQGYYCSGPLPEDAFLRLLRSSGGLSAQAAC